MLAANVVLNEIYYDPPDKSVPAEYIELFNAGDAPADLSGWSFSDGVEFQFDLGTMLADGEYLVVAQDLAGYAAMFSSPGSPIAYGVPAGTLGGQNFDGSLGMDFVVNTEVRVIELGAFDSGSDGLTRSITVQLWSRNDAGTPTNPRDDVGTGVLAVEVFTTADPGTLVGGSRMKPLDTPLVLSPGAYTIVAQGYGTGELLYNAGSVGAGSTDSGNGLLSFVGSSRWIDAASFPTNVDSHTHQYAAGTFRYEPTADLPVFVPAQGPWLGKLSNDGERVTLSNELGQTVDEVDYRVGFPWPISANGDGASMELLHPALDNDLGSSWRSSVAPTPGIQNSVHDTNPPPNLRQVNHSPGQPASGQEIAVSVKATDTDGIADVTLEYQLVEPGDYIALGDSRYQTEWTAVAMTDDGSGSNVYTVTLPGSLQVHRRLVRYRITATDSLGASVTAPFADDPQPNFVYFVYDDVPAWTGADEPGVTDPVTYGNDVMTSLPVHHLISRESDVLNSQYNNAYNDKVFRFEGTLVAGGEIYDHVYYRIRGSGSTHVSGKNKWKFRFHRGHYYQGYDQYGNPWPEDLKTVNFGSAASPWAPANRGLAGMDEALAFQLFNMVDVAAPRLSPLHFRVIDGVDEGPGIAVDPSNQYAGDLWGLYLAFENSSGDFLESHDLPDGNLYRYDWSAELENQGPGLPAGVSLANSFVAAYNQTNPPQPVSWWRENVDLDGYYSLRSIVETINHTDLTEQHNMQLFYNPETQKWSQLPWDLDLLYEEFDRWGPDGVQSQLPYEQFRKALLHPELNIEFQARARELQDLLLNRDQVWQMVEEYARYVEPFAAVDRAMWDYHPRTTGPHKGAFYQEVAVYSTGGAAGQVRRAISPVGFEGMVNWVKNFIVTAPGLDGFGGDQLQALHADPDIPNAPTITYVGMAGQPIDGLAFQTGAFDDPQGSQTFGAVQWRIGEVTDPTSPAYDPTAPVVYEIDSVWETDRLTTFADTVNVSSDALKIGRTYRVRVRMQDDSGRWSHWSEPAQFVPTAPGGTLPADATNLVITELNYNPHDAGPGEIDTDNDDFEYIELINVGGQMIELGGVEFVEVDLAGDTQGVRFTFDTQTLDPGERIVAVRDVAAFQSRYGNQIRIAAGDDGAGGIDGQYGGGLSNGGEQLTLHAASGSTIAGFTYGDSGPWPGRADGGGSSLELLDTGGDPDDPANWRSSSEFGGSPGSAGLGPVESIVINEVLTHTDPPTTASDSIELHNPTAADISLGGWFLSDSGNTADGSDGYRKFQIPLGTVIPSGGYLVFDEDDFNPAPETPGVNDFALSGAHGDDVWLLRSDAQGKLTYFVDHVEFGAAANDESFGRWPNGSGGLYPMVTNTLGDANSGPRIGPVIVSEIMYHPTPPTPQDFAEFPALTEDDLEYIEIYNPTDAPIYLTNWRIRGGVDFDFPAGMVLGAGQARVILSFDPDEKNGQGQPVNTERANAFRSHYGLNPGIPLIGGYSGKLDDGGERVQLQRPDEPPIEEPTFVPRLLEDEARYDDVHPWPTQTDGSGSSLTRYDPAGWGHDSTSWAAADPSPGQHMPPENTLDVIEFTPNASGFYVRFNRPLDPSVVSLYDVEAGVHGPADVTLVGNVVGPVPGSLVLNGDSFWFVATDGPLPADTFTVTLRGADDALRDESGQPLDGGGDSVHAFDTAPRAVVLGLPDFARGPGQPVELPAGTDGLPLILSDNRIGGSDLKSVELVVTYDPALLNVTAAALGPGAPEDATLLADVDTAGVVTLSLSSLATPLGRGLSPIIMLTADVPAGAAPGTSGLVRISNLVVTDTTQAVVPATADDAIHAIAYLGDTTGNGQYSGLDAQRAARVGVGLDGGLEAFPIVDAAIIADVTGDGSISGLDAQRIAQEAVGLDSTEIPPIVQPLRQAEPPKPGFLSSPLTDSKPTKNEPPEAGLLPPVAADSRIRQTLAVQTSGVGDSFQLSPTPEVFLANERLLAVTFPLIDVTVTPDFGDTLADAQGDGVDVSGRLNDPLMNDGLPAAIIDAVFALLISRQ